MSFEFFHLQNSEIRINFRNPLYISSFCTCNDVLEREQLVGMMKKKDPKRLLMLLATASCVGSTLYPCSLPNCFAVMVFQIQSPDWLHISQSAALFENPPNDKVMIYPMIEIGIIVSIDSPTVSKDGI